MPTSAGKGAAGGQPVSLRTHWQAPVLLLAVVLLFGGVMTAILTAPKPNIVRMLDEAEQLIGAEKYQPAMEVLNKKLLPYHNAGSLDADQRRQFHLLRARAMYLGERAAGVEFEENAKNIADEYGEVGVEGVKLEPRDRFYLANTQVVLKKFKQAIDLAYSMPAESRVEKGKIIKRVVEGLLAAPNFDADTTLRLIAEFLSEREVTIADRGWALARQSELLMRQGLMTSAINKMLQTLPSLINDLGRDQLGELYLLLGRAYFETDALTEAGRQLNLAAKLLLPSDLKHAEATVLLAHIDEQIGDPPEEGRAQAKQKYRDVIERFGTSEARYPALLGLGEVNAAMGNTPDSLVAYGELVHELAGGKSHPDTSVRAVTDSLMSRASARFEAGKMDEALDFATLAEKLYTPDTVPPETLALIARAHRRAAEDLYVASETGSAKLLELARLDPATREQVRLHLVAAGRYFKRHADRIAINDNAGFGKSLWMAADCFDNAGDPDQAIPLFSDFAKYFESDRRQPEAKYRLAAAYQAKGDYGMAEQSYTELIARASQPGGNVGPLGDQSYVPLAQCYLLDADPSNDAQAEPLLIHVAEGHAGSTNSAQFRDALIELGRLRTAKGDYAGAIQLLDEAATRFPDWTQIDSVRYSLADALRQDARAILKTLSEAMPDGKKQALIAARTERLRRAVDLFDRARRSLEGRDPRRLSKLEQIQLRNSYFYGADCEFDLKDYDSAIRHYDAAREKYATDPASLLAMVQIVNAYIEQGDTQRAKTAQERALRFYQGIPAAAWADKDLPMSQDAWKDWLHSMNKLNPIDTPPANASGSEGVKRGEDR